MPLGCLQSGQYVNFEAREGEGEGEGEGERVQREKATHRVCVRENSERDPERESHTGERQSNTGSERGSRERDPRRERVTHRISLRRGTTPSILKWKRARSFQIAREREREREGESERDGA